MEAVDGDDDIVIWGDSASWGGECLYGVELRMVEWIWVEDVVKPGDVGLGGERLLPTHLRFCILH